MKPLNDLVRLFDALVLKLISNDELRERISLLDADARDYDSPYKKMLYDAYDAIDTKAAAVLQHVSIMTAVAGLLFSQSETGIFRWLLGLETLVYVILALSCLRLLMTDHYYMKPNDSENAAAKEAVLEITAKLTFLVSVVLIATIFAKLVVR